MGRVLFAMVVPEYASLPLFFHLGREQLSAWAWALQACFVVFSGYVQWYISEDYRRPGSLVPSLTESGLDGEVMTGCNPVRKYLRAPKHKFDFVAQLPNYIHDQQTATVAGVGFATWTTAMQREWERRWQGVPGGDFIGESGIPQMLIWLVVFSCVVHTEFAWLSYSDHVMDEQADAANLLFLGSRFAKTERQELGFSITRIGTMLCIKVPLLYFKTSMAMMLWPCLKPVGRLQHISAIMLGWYSCKPAIWCGIRLCRGSLNVDRKWRCRLMIALPGIYIFLTIMAVHTLGIFLCDSHDLSLLHGGCTAPATRDFCRA